MAKKHRIEKLAENALVSKNDFLPNGNPALPHWRMATRLLVDPTRPFVLLEYKGKGSSKVFKAEFGDVTESYRAGGFITHKFDKHFLQLLSF